MTEDWLTTQKAAELSGYNLEYVRRLVRNGKIKARKFGPVWQVSRLSLMDYLNKVEPSGDGRRGPRN